MRFYATILTVFISGVCFSQQSTTQTPKETIKTFFKAFHEGDTTLLKTTIYNTALLQTATKNKEGKDVLYQSSVSDLIKAIANRPADQKWEERLLSFTVNIDENMANVWTPYEFWFNGSFSHCGVNSFQLFNDNGSWKIIYLIDTRKREGCNR